MKKAIFYTMDALLASMLLIGAVLLIYSTYEQNSSGVEQKIFLTQDILTVFSGITLSEINNSFITQEFDNGNITNLNNTLLEQIGEYWALNNTVKAQQLFSSVMSEELITGSGLRLSIDNEEIYIKNYSSKKSLFTFNRMISGIVKGAPLTGYSSSAYLKKIRDKKTSSYAYFGGFIGQGNITLRLDLPADFNSTKLIDSYIKIETPGSFEIFINGNQCGTNYSGAAGQVNLWTITSCNASLISGTNNFTFAFISPLNISYVSGGLIKATYITDTLVENVATGYKRVYLPSVTGFINLYDAVSVQGIITDITLNITYDSIYSTFFTFGNETLFIDPGQNTTRNIFIVKNNLSIPPSTIPIRMAHTNLSNISVLDAGVPSDSFLVTDVSGSMNDCAVYVNQTMCRYQYKQASWWWFWLTTTCAYNNVSCNNNECGISPIYSTRSYSIINQSVCSKTLLDVAKDADKLFVEVVLGASSLHRVGLIDFSNDAHTPTNLTNVESVLDSEIDTYSPNGGTCTCCGINYARNLVNSSTNKKFMIVLSDGEPNYYCSNYNDYTGTSGSDSLSESWAINASILACQNNITVYAIGFGTAMTAAGHNIMKQIACNASLYYNVTDTSQLEDVYRNISEQILIAANFSSQTINLVGNFSPTKLHTDSYIDLYYQDLNPIDTQNKISVLIESPQFNSCNVSIDIPSGIVIQDAYAASYSSNHWTDLLKINENVVFNLSQYNSSYDLLGDPFLIQIPSLLLYPGQSNNISLRVGDSTTNSSNCSNNNTLIYTALVTASVARTDIKEKNVGCTWTVEYVDGEINTIKVPAAYAGTKNCTYTSVNISYDLDDTYDVATYSLLKQLDTENSGKVLVNINNLDLEIITTVIGGVPYLWGPSIIRLEVWQ
jgi:hypothetical protein